MSRREAIRRAIADFETLNGAGASIRELAIGVPHCLVLLAIAAVAAAVLP